MSARKRSSDSTFREGKDLKQPKIDQFFLSKKPKQEKQPNIDKFLVKTKKVISLSKDRKTIPSSSLNNNDKSFSSSKVNIIEITHLFMFVFVYHIFMIVFCWNITDLFTGT